MECIDIFLFSFMSANRYFVSLFHTIHTQCSCFFLCCRYDSGKRRVVCYILWPDGKYPTSVTDYMYVILKVSISFHLMQLASIHLKIMCRKKMLHKNDEKKCTCVVQCVNELEIQGIFNFGEKNKM